MVKDTGMRSAGPYFSQVHFQHFQGFMHFLLSGLLDVINHKNSLGKP
jgi:hypothetical protein